VPTSIQDPLKSGEMLGAYEITEVIAVGHSNAIYAARHKQTDRSVAVRILLAELGTDPLEVKRSVNAARVLGRISHENVVTVYDFGMSSTGLPYTVMELINGRTMQSLLKEEGTLSALRLRRLFGQICLAMSAVHAKQIVHRDLKPAKKKR
jgi:serine/threonine protein kinase